MSQGRERRRSARAEHRDQIIVKVVSSDSDELPAGRTVYCRTADISRHGLRLRVEQDLTPGTLLELWVIPHDRKGTLVLTGVVKWCRADLEQKFLSAGIEIREEPTVDYKEWEDMLSDIAPEEEE